MKSAKPVLIICALIGLSLIMLGCATAQSPKTLEPGEISLGTCAWGGTELPNEVRFRVGMPELNAYTRLGVFDGLDIGIRLGKSLLLYFDRGYIPLDVGYLLMDVKHEIWNCYSESNKVRVQLNNKIHFQIHVNVTFEIMGVINPIQFGIYEKVWNRKQT